MRRHVRVLEPSLHPSFVRLLDRVSPVVCPKTTKDHEIRAHLAQRGQRDCIVATLGAADQPIGLLCVANRLGNVATFDEQDARLFETIAAQTAIALQNAHLVDQLRHEALHDSLTDLANRALLKQRLADVIARRRPCDPEIAVMLIDLDRFKEINDTLGHEAGDVLLQEVAARLVRSVSDSVTVARLGGDEFALLDPSESGPERALELAMRVRRSLNDPIPYMDLELRVSTTLANSRSSPNSNLGSKTAASSSTTNRKCASTPEQLSVLRPSSTGCIRPKASYHQTSSYRSRNGPG